MYYNNVKINSYGSNMILYYKTAESSLLAVLKFFYPATNAKLHFSFGKFRPQCQQLRLLKRMTLFWGYAFPSAIIWILINLDLGFYISSTI